MYLHSCTFEGSNVLSYENNTFVLHVLPHYVQYFRTKKGYSTLVVHVHVRVHVGPSVCNKKLFLFIMHKQLYVYNVVHVYVYVYSSRVQKGTRRLDRAA